LGVASSQWFIAEGRQILSFQRSLLGAIFNILLNLLLIPKFGAIGAAFATILSYAVAALFFDLIQSMSLFLLPVLHS
jgi:PST family polysaccharide transporter